MNSRQSRTGGPPLIVVAMALGAFFACAESDESTSDDAGAPPDASVLPESAPEVDAASDADADAPDSCNENGFCYVPLSIHRPLMAVSASRRDDVWVIAGGSALARWDGASWETVYEYAGPSFSNVGFIGVWAAKHDDVWVLALGDFKLFFVRYSSQSGGTPAFREALMDRDINSWGSVGAWMTPSADAFWLVNGGVVHRIHEGLGGTMIVEPMDPLVGSEDMSSSYQWESGWSFGAQDTYVGGAACSDLYCQEKHGAIAHYDGSNWSIQVLDTTDAVTSMFGTGADQPRQLWFKAGGSIFLAPIADDGGLRIPRPMTNVQCYSFFGSAAPPNVAWFSDGCLLYRWDGNHVTTTKYSLGHVATGWLNGIWADSVENVWIVGRRTPAPTDLDVPSLGFAALRKGKPE